MKKKMYTIRDLLLLFLFWCLCSAAFAETASETFSTQPSTTVNTLIITFDAPVIHGVNQSENLFNGIVNYMNNPESGPGKEINQLGAIWTASFNLSGVQFALFYPDDPEKAVELSVNLLNGLKKNKVSMFSEQKPLDFAGYLHQLCPTGRNPENAVSIYTEGRFSEFRKKLEAEAAELKPFYEESEVSTETEKPVFSGILPTVYEIFHWNQLDSSVFFSAKFTGEQFIREIAGQSQIRYELLYGENSLNLAVFVSGTEEELFDSFHHLKNIRESVVRPNSQRWQGFAEAAEALLTDDMRDAAKTAMLKAWLKHWGSTADINEKPLKFVQPVKNHGDISMPQKWQHQFSYSENLFPVFAACSCSDSSEIADIAISIAASSSAILNEIVDCLQNRQAISFPFSVEAQNNQRVIINFHSTIAELSGNIARLRARILNSLFEKGLISELPGPLAIGISGVCLYPPFMLRGILQEGWPATSLTSEFRLADFSEISSRLGFLSNDPDASRRRWEILSSSSRGKAEILSILASERIRLLSFAFQR